jgi:hypothetical protein
MKQQNVRNIKSIKKGNEFCHYSLYYKAAKWDKGKIASKNDLYENTDDLQLQF